MEVVLAEGVAGAQDVVIRRRCPVVGGVPRNADHPVAKRAPELLAGQGPPPQRADVRVPLPVRRHTAGHLLQDIARFSVRRDDRIDLSDVRGDLVSADPVSVDQRAPVTKPGGAGVVVGV
jgi:hypothetical protein